MSEGWRSNVDTHKMKPEDIKAYGVEASKRPPGHHPGEVLHQRRSLPFRPIVMAVGGFLIIATIGYCTLYHKAKPGTSAADITKATVGPSDSGDTRRAK